MMQHPRKPASHYALVGLAAAVLPALFVTARAEAAPVSGKLPVAILGIRPGMDLDDAHALLRKQGAFTSADTGKNAAHKDMDKAKPADADADRDKSDALPKDKDALKSKPPASDEDDDEGHQEAWKLRSTPYSQIALASDDKGHVLWVTGFVRPGKEIPFASLGDTKQTAAVSPAFAVWNVIVPYKSYRVVARGRGGKASTVSMLTLTMANPNGIFSPAVVPARK